MLTVEDIPVFLKMFPGLEASDLGVLLTHARIRRLSCGEVWLAKGTLTRSLAYIQQGMIRAYRVGENDEERTLLLRWEGQFIAAIDSLLYALPSGHHFAALEETVLIELDNEGWAVIDAVPRLATLRGHVLLLMLGQAMERVETFVWLSPEDRYKKLLSEKPDIVNRVPDKHLATYLGITPVSLSRIRRRIAGH